MGVIDVALGCALVVFAIGAKAFYPGRAGWNRGLNSLPTGAWRIIFLLGGVVAMMNGIYKLIRH